MKTPKLQLWFVVLASLLSVPPEAFAKRRPIFAESAVAGLPDPADEAVTRSRFVRVSHRNLRAGAKASVLDLNLFPGRAVRARIVRKDAFPTHTVYVGRLEGRYQGEAVLVVQDGVIAGTIRSGGKLFQIRYAGRGVHEVQEIDPSLLPAEEDPLDPEDDPLDPEGEFDAMDSATVEAAADDGSLIDVFVAYTPAARSAAGGTSGIQSRINLGVAETNQAYANSGVIQRLRLVGTAEIAYTESGSFSDDLSRLRSPSDGYMDEVHSLRDGSGADLVHLITEKGSSCGMGYVMNNVSSSFASSAFAVTKRGCISPNLTFAHELGHNMGLQHDRYVNQSNSPYSYSHGYVNQAAFVPGADTTKRWRTVMAYNDECAAAGFSCKRVMYFSDPTRTYTGDPMGISGSGSTSSQDGPANERLSLDNTRTTVANFRVGATSPPPPAPPATPTTLSPTGDVTDTTPTFQWSRLADATSYELWVQMGTLDVYALTYSAAAAGCGTASPCSATPAPALALGSHTFRVRASNSAGSSAWSAARAFDVVTPTPAPPATPTTLSPTGSITDTTPTFQWSGVADATNYELWVRRGTVDVYTQTYSATAAGCETASPCSATPAPALALGSHTFQVRASNSVGSSAWSAARAFDVVTLASGFDSQFNGSMTPWLVHSGTWSIVSAQQLYSKGMVGKFASVSHPTSFTNLDYRVRLSRTGSNLGNPVYLMIRGNPNLLSDGRWSQGYRFQISQNGQFAVLRDSNMLQDWTATPALNQGSAWNELGVVAIGQNLSFYINGTLVWSGTDATFASGRVGIGMYQAKRTKGNGIYVDYATLTVP